jgi:succinyl-diaminopimelate desuccinylase
MTTSSTSSLQEELLHLTSDLMRFESTSDRPDQLTAITDYVEGYLRDVPGLFLHRSEAEGKPALVATYNDTRTPTIMFNGHLDVVPASPEQFEPRREGNRLYGRGSQDMKSGVAVLMRLLKEFATNHNADGPHTLPNIGVQFVTDEEIGGEAGTGRLQKEGWGCELLVITEPTDLRICYEQKGILWLRMRMRGTSAHGSRPWHGCNPILGLNHGLTQIFSRYPPPTKEVWATTVLPTTLRTPNTTINRIPEEVEMTFDIRYLPEEDPNQLLTMIRELFPGAEVEQERCAVPMSSDPNHPRIQQLAIAGQQGYGRRLPLYREHFGSDGRFYSKAGMAAVCLGVKGAGLHSDNEWVEVESMAHLYQTLAAFLQTL